MASLPLALPSHGLGTPSTQSPAPTQSQGHENTSVVGPSGPSYQPSVYHPHAYPQFYNQSMPYGYSIQPTTQASAPLTTSSLSNVPAATPHSEPSLTPVPVSSPGEDTKFPALAKRGRPRKQPAAGGEIITGQIGKNSVSTPSLTATSARRPNARKGRIPGSQNWSARDLIALAHYVEGEVPLGMNVWKRIEGLYNNEYAIPNNRQERGWDNMRDKWYKVGSTYICTLHIILTRHNTMVIGRVGWSSNR
jgi:hypothetical protein